jgi:hypothetical protein
VAATNVSGARGQAHQPELAEVRTEPPSRARGNAADMGAQW